MYPAMLLAGAGDSGLPLVSFTYSSSADNVNFLTSVEGVHGTLSSPVLALITVNGGVTLGSASKTNPAARTGGFPSGSLVKLINNGRIAGRGGDGGNGAQASSPAGGDGDDGGTALELDDDIQIDNTSGEIFGGGGGGGGGAAATSAGAPNGGGGGGGGQGDNGGDKGVALSSGNDGQNGGTSSAGNGGNGATYGGKGGNGGSWGQGGKDGKGPSILGGQGGDGGAGGKAVDLNGNTITWIAGNNATQVKGSVS